MYVIMMSSMWFILPRFKAGMICILTRSDAVSSIEFMVLLMRLFPHSCGRPFAYVNQNQNFFCTFIRVAEIVIQLAEKRRLCQDFAYVGGFTVRSAKILW